jgi:hypothetical protein
MVHQHEVTIQQKSLSCSAVYSDFLAFNRSLILNFTHLIELAQQALHVGFGREGTDGLPGTSAYGMPA